MGQKTAPLHASMAWPEECGEAVHGGRGGAGSAMRWYKNECGIDGKADLGMSAESHQLYALPNDNASKQSESPEKSRSSGTGMQITPRHIVHLWQQGKLNYGRGDM